jgi:hypothetical protein
MNPRKDAEVGEGWFVVVSETATSRLTQQNKNYFYKRNW